MTKVLGAPALEMTPNAAGTDMDFTNRNVSVPKMLDEKNVPGILQLDQKRLNANSGEYGFLVSLPKMHGIWAIPLEVTYKPWINLVWVGVIVMGLGVGMAMVRRTLEARQVTDGPLDSAKSRVASLATPGNGADSSLEVESVEPTSNGSGNGKNGHSTPVKSGKARTTTRR